MEEIEAIRGDGRVGGGDPPAGAGGRRSGEAGGREMQAFCELGLGTGRAKGAGVVGGSSLRPSPRRLGEGRRRPQVLEWE